MQEKQHPFGSEITSGPEALIPAQDLAFLNTSGEGWGLPSITIQKLSQLLLGLEVQGHQFAYLWTRVTIVDLGTEVQVSAHLWNFPTAKTLHRVGLEKCPMVKFRLCSSTGTVSFSAPGIPDPYILAPALTFTSLSHTQHTYTQPKNKKKQV